MPAAPLRDGQLGAYLYCFARPGAAQDLTLPGVDGQSAIETLETRGLAAVFSRVPVVEFDPLVQGESLDPAWVVPRAVRHEQVIEAVMARSPVLPVRFGSLFSSPEALATFFADQADTITRFLDQLADRQEWAVKMWLDVERMIDWLLAHDPSLSERYRQLPQTPGTRYFQEKRLRADAQREGRRRAQLAAQEILAELPSIAGKVCVLPLRKLEDAGKEMVLHAAVLLPEGAMASVASRLKEMSSRHSEEGLDVECSGPWPPYNFCPVLQP